MDAGVDHDANDPIKPVLPNEWKSGMPCHWTEQTKDMRRKSTSVRSILALNFVVGALYLSYRATMTIGKITRHPAMLAYQLFFFFIEFVCVISIVFRFVELYSRFSRNAVDFKRIPNELLAARNIYQQATRPEFSNYPSVAVFILCYNEDADLVLQTVLGAVAMDYP